MPSANGHGPKPERIALLLRVSSEEQRERETIEIQEEFLDQYCGLYELEVAEIYKDDGVSGTIPLHERPEGRRLLEDAKEDKFDVMLVYKLDRLGRTLLVIVDAHDRLQEAGVALRSATEPIDTSTLSGRLIFQMLASFAEYDRANIRERTKPGLQRAFRNGKQPGMIPYGYDIAPDGSFVIVEDEARIVAEIIANIAAGATLYSEAERLNDEGVPSPGNKYRSRPRREYLLRGLVRCEQCGASYSGGASASNGYRYHYYSSARDRAAREKRLKTNHSCPRVRAEWLEELVWSDVRSFLKNPGEVLERARAELAEDAESEDLEERHASLTRRLTAKQAEKGRYVKLYAQGHLDEEELEVYLVDLKNQVENLKLLISSVEADIVRKEEDKLTAQTTEAWLLTLRERVEEVEEDTEEALEKRRELVKLLVEQITVDRNEDGHSQVQITYRFGPPPEEPESVYGVAHSRRLETPKVSLERSVGCWLNARWRRLALHSDVVGAHLGMSSQEAATTAPTMGHFEFIAMNPRVKGVFVLPACDHQHLVRLFGAQYLHRDETWEVLHEPPTIGEPLDDLVSHPLFHR